MLLLLGGIVGVGVVVTVGEFLDEVHFGRVGWGFGMILSRGGMGGGCGVVCQQGVLEGSEKMGRRGESEETRVRGEYSAQEKEGSVGSQLTFPG